ncbi:class I SAM-dependent methyltransferase [Dactylosporangium sp. CS-033363]|uniref:class I SAM-dependent methyltransferase n=1 Tax=Dactylosporangium sp. CS-033363 TaxID=3239935 RepID=UPI003D8C5BF7
MRALPFQAGSLDGVWCQAALLHVPLGGVPAVLAEFGRVVRAGGPWQLTVAEGDGEGWQSELYDGNPRWFAHHRADSLTAMLADAGFAAGRVRRRSANREWLAVRARKR